MTERYVVIGNPVGHSLSPLMGYAALHRRTIVARGEKANPRCALVAS